LRRTIEHGLPLRFTQNAEDVVKVSNYPDIRFFTVQGHPAYHRADAVAGTWKIVSPETADFVSAVAFYFAPRVQHDIHVPIGLVVAVDGAPVESQTSEGALRRLHDFDVPLAELEKLTAAGAPKYGNYIMHCYDQYDTGLKGTWSAPDLNDSDWKPVQIPSAFSGRAVQEHAWVSSQWNQVCAAESASVHHLMQLMHHGFKGGGESDIW